MGTESFLNSLIREWFLSGEISPLKIERRVHKAYERRRDAQHIKRHLDDVFTLERKHNDSYFTFAGGGYIIRISPAAIGILAVPT